MTIRHDLLSGENDRRSRFPFGLTMFSGFVGLVGVVAVLVLSLVNDYQDANQRVQMEVENISRLLEEHVLATVHKSDLLLREIQRNVRQDDMRVVRPAPGPRAQELHELLKSQIESVQEVAVIHVTNAKGDHIYSSIYPTPEINIADRYHFQRNRDDPAAGLVISSPIVSRTTGKWTIVLARRLNSEDGRFAGIINVILDLEYFQRFYRTLDLGPHGLVALYDQQLRLAARHPPSEKDMGQVSGVDVRSYVEKGVAHAIYRARSPLDGVERLLSFRQVDGLPLLVLAGVAEEDYLVEWRRHVVQYGVGALIFAVVVIGFGMLQRRTDTTIRRLNAELEQRVAQRTAQLEAANKEIEEFSYSMSHDMRTPLRALDGFSTMLLENYGAQLDDEGNRLLKVLRDNAQRMGRLVDDILRFMSMGRRRMRVSSVDIASLASQIFAELQAAAPARRLRLEIGTVPPAWGDRLMIHQVLQDLLSNAVKFSPTDAEAVIELSGTAEEKENIYSIRDHGVGFDMRYADKLFKVFERVHATGQYEGSGIGLAIVKRIVERHGGRVWAQGRVGEGATFCFSLPHAASNGAVQEQSEP